MVERFTAVSYTHLSASVGAVQKMPSSASLLSFIISFSVKSNNIKSSVNAEADDSGTIPNNNASVRQSDKALLIFLNLFTVFPPLNLIPASNNSKAIFCRHPLL